MNTYLYINNQYIRRYSRLTIIQSINKVLIYKKFQDPHVSKEQGADNNTIPGDIALRVPGAEHSRIFYDVTVIKCLTDDAIRRASIRRTQKISRTPASRTPSIRNSQNPKQVSLGGWLMLTRCISTGVWHEDSSRAPIVVSNGSRAHRSKRKRSLEIIPGRTELCSSAQKRNALKAAREHMKQENASNLRSENGWSGGVLIGPILYYLYSYRLVPLYHILQI